MIQSMPCRTMSYFPASWPMRHISCYSAAGFAIVTCYRATWRCDEASLSIPEYSALEMPEQWDAAHGPEVLRGEKQKVGKRARATHTCCSWVGDFC